MKPDPANGRRRAKGLSDSGMRTSNRRAVLVFVAAGLAGCGASQPAPIAPDCPARPAGFPPELERFRAQVDATRLPYVAITARAGATALRDSKFLGLPYWPEDRPYPTDVEGNRLELLAQINFAEMPPLQDHPSSGILQFFISPGMSERHVWGMVSYDGHPFDPAAYFASLQRQDYFRVVYHPSPASEDGLLIDESPGRGKTLMPIDAEARLSFTPKVGFVLTTDYRFTETLGLDLYALYDQLGADACAVMKAYDDYAGEIPLARIGGYAAPVQEDPRSIDPDGDWVVLLEIQSGRLDGGGEVMWGDAGMAMFLIRRGDLLRRDFSRVAYYWDNH